MPETTLLERLKLAIDGVSLYLDQLNELNPDGKEPVTVADVELHTAFRAVEEQLSGISTMTEELFLLSEGLVPSEGGSVIVQRRT